jgi:hypothetical protein
MNTHTVKLYFPSVDQDNKPLEQLLSTRIYKQTIKEISLISGGCSVYPIEGYYINSKDQLIQDDISLIVAYSDKLSELTSIVKENAMIILKSLNQESVLIEINNSLEFITLES